MSSSKTSAKSFLVSTIATVLVCGTLVGCAKEGSQNPFLSSLTPSAAIEQASAESAKRTSPATIQQTAFETSVAAPTWHDSLTAAIAEAKANDKLILADFTGSDWCHYCVKLKKEVFDTPEFKSWASDNVVLLELDFPKRSQLSPAVREQNEMLKSRFNITSYPTVLLLDAEGNIQAKMGYERGKSSSQWVQLAESKLQQNASRNRSVATGQGSESLFR